MWWLASYAVVAAGLFVALSGAFTGMSKTQKRVMAAACALFWPAAMAVILLAILADLLAAIGRRLRP